MNKRLKYNKYRDMDNIITIDLHNGYTIIAIISKTNNDFYDVQLMLKENTIDKLDSIDKANNIVIHSDETRICSAILKIVDTYLHEGFFNQYISRYEYELNCFTVGDEINREKGLYINNAL